MNTMIAKWEIINILLQGMRTRLTNSYCILFITKCSSQFKTSDAFGSLRLKAKLHLPSLHGEELDHAIMVPNHHL